MTTAGTDNPARRWAHRGAALAAAVAVAGAGVLVTATNASAAPVSCSATPLHDIPRAQCAQVTAINPGSYLLLHNQPNYSGGVAPGSGQYVNGTWLILYCWTTGAGDADGHGDTYWFNADDDNGNIGFVNDWYVTSGSYAEWSPVIPHC